MRPAREDRSYTDFRCVALAFKTRAAGLAEMTGPDCLPRMQNTEERLP